MSTIRFLHLSDTHFGGAGHGRDWIGVRDHLLRDLERATKRLEGRPDVILFTGDLTNHGTDEHFDVARTEIDWLRKQLDEPIFVAVPGNHDLVRPSADLSSSYTWLFGDDPPDKQARERVWDESSSEHERVRECFRPWLTFEDEMVAALDERGGQCTVRRGVLPGDLFVSLRIAGVRLAILGLNSAWRQYGGFDFRGRVSVERRQIDALLGDDGMAGLGARHEATLLLQHHPPDWLDGTLIWENDVERWVDVALFGHMHEHEASRVFENSNRARNRVQAMSVFGLEHYGQEAESRLCGYSWGRVDVGARVTMRLWQRTQSDRTGKFRHPDVDYEEDEGLVVLERDPPRPPTPGATPEGKLGLTEAPARVRTYFEWASRRFSEVRVVGFQDRYKIRLPLDDVFVKLTARLEHLPGIEGKGAHPHDAEPRTDLAGAIARAHERPGCRGVVVLGDPGSGKSTVLQHLFCRVASEGSLAVGLPAGLSPVLLRLSRLGDEAPAPDFLAQLIEAECRATGHEAAAAWLASHERPMLYLLDGLDEVASEERRKQVSAAIDDSRHRVHPDSFFVVTCRYAAYQRDTRLPNVFLQADLEWLDEAQVHEFIGRWFAAVYAGLGLARAEGQQKAEELTHALLDPRRQVYGLREITQNPLLLSNLCLLFHSGAELPKRRAVLYDRCISLLLETWSKEKHGRSALPDHEAREVLQPLAWAMHEKRVRSLPGADVRAVIAEPLQEVSGLELTPDEFLRIAQETAGLFGGRDVDSYEFLHLSFQEFLAAAHAEARGWAARLADRLGDPWWRETIQLAMTFSGFVGSFLEAACQNGLVEHEEQLVDCLREAVRVEPAPLLEVVRSGEQPRAVTALRLLRVVPADRVESDLSTIAEQATDDWRREMISGRPAASVRAAAAGADWTEPRTGIELLWVPAGSFLMGSSKTAGEPGHDEQAYDAELPAHEVTLSQGYWIARHPVTNAQYGEFMKDERGVAKPSEWNNRRFNGGEQPVVGVSWHDAVRFCEWLTESLDETTRTFGLPTEAQWERAARGTDERKFPWGEEPPTPEHANFGSEPGHTLPVGGRPAGASPVGCHDMAGNVWEWCRDTWRGDYGSPEAVTDPLHEAAGDRVVRGGSWGDGPRDLRCAYRGRGDPGARDDDLGFRVVCVFPPEHC